MRALDGRHPLDDCPGCGAPMALVLEILGGPEAHGGGAFRSCEGCGERYARAGGDRRWLNRRSYRMLTREILRLRALVPPELAAQRDGWYVPRSLEEALDPALPRNIGEAAQQVRLRREGEG